MLIQGPFASSHRKLLPWASPSCSPLCTCFHSHVLSSREWNCWVWVGERIKLSEEEVFFLEHFCRGTFKSKILAFLSAKLILVEKWRNMSNFKSHSTLEILTKVVSSSRRRLICCQYLLPYESKNDLWVINIQEYSQCGTWTIFNLDGFNEIQNSLLSK